MKTKEELDKMINDHWKYVSNLIMLFGADEQSNKECEFMYKSAFLHGWKHSKEDSNDTNISTN